MYYEDTRINGQFLLLLHIWVGMNLSIFILLAIYTGNKQIELFIRVLSRLKYDASNLSPDFHVHPYKSH